VRHENPGKAFSGQTDSTKTGANSIRTRTFGAVSEALGLSILGTIDQVTNAQGGLVVSAQSHSSIARALRMLATNTRFSSLDYPLRTLLVARLVSLGKR
jgi:hypothetical protein